MTIFLEVRIHVLSDDAQIRRSLNPGFDNSNFDIDNFDMFTFQLHKDCKLTATKA